jgi:hypothetical protein
MTTPVRLTTVLINGARSLLNAEAIDEAHVFNTVSVGGVPLYTQKKRLSTLASSP